MYFFLPYVKYREENKQKYTPLSIVRKFLLTLPYYDY